MKQNISLVLVVGFIMSAACELDAVAKSKSTPKTSLKDETVVKKTAPVEPKYKSVTADPEGTQYFRGKPFAQKSDLFFGFGLDFFKAFGLQGRYAERLIEEGFIPDINDSFSVEGGLGLTFYGKTKGKSGVTGFSFLAMGRWDFQMDEMWLFFANLGLGYTAVTAVDTGDVRGGGLFPAIGVGAMYNFGSEWAARADFSYQFFGIGILHRF